MRSIAEQIAALEKELSECPGGYISRKVISGKERFYLQWTVDGKVKSKYIKADELDEVRASVDRRHELQEKLKEQKATPEGIKTDHLKRKTVRNMQNITGTLMSEDTPILNGQSVIREIIEADEGLAEDDDGPIGI